MLLKQSFIIILIIVLYYKEVLVCNIISSLRYFFNKELIYFFNCGNIIIEMKVQILKGIFFVFFFCDVRVYCIEEYYWML